MPRFDRHPQVDEYIAPLPEDEPINEGALVELLRQIIANNRAGGWRKLKAEGGAGESGG